MHLMLALRLAYLSCLRKLWLPLHSVNSLVPWVYTQVCVLANPNAQSTGNLSYVRLRHACDLDRHHHLVGQLVVRSRFPVDHTTVGLAQTYSNNYTHVLTTKSWPTQDRFLKLHSQPVSVEEVFRSLRCGVKLIYTIAIYSPSNCCSNGVLQLDTM